jgi:hypothetical protein
MDSYFFRLCRECLPQLLHERRKSFRHDATTCTSSTCPVDEYSRTDASPRLRALTPRAPRPAVGKVTEEFGHGCAL